MVPTVGNLVTIDAWEREDGAPAPLGATWVQQEQAWNLPLHSPTASALTLLSP